MRRPLKVLHLSASDKGGAFVVAQTLVENIKDVDIIANHLVFTGERSNLKISNLNTLDRLLKFALHAYEKFILMFYEKNKSIRFKYSLGRPGIPFSFLKKKINECDIIHLHWINKGFIDINDIAKFNKPIVWTCHDIWAVTGGCHLTNGCMNFISGCGDCPMLARPEKNDISKKLVDKKETVYRNADLTFVSPSEWMDFNIASSYLGKGFKHLVIPNGIDTSVFRFKPVKRTGNKFVIGFVAANLNDENKALHRLISAIDLLPDKSVISLMLVGEQKAPFRFSIPCEYKIISGVNGSENMAVLYLQMDALAITSTLETFPTTLMEASCCGVSLIGFNVGGIKEIIIPFTGQLISAFDIESYAKGILHFLENKMDKATLSDFSRGKFGNRAMVKAYTELYRQKITQ
jgi:glycosyltransferase involved in cell wall biosynthesis